MDEQPTLEEASAPPTYCLQSPPCPMGWCERIWRWVEKERKGIGFPSFHTRFHELYSYAVQVDPETASWKSAWASTILEYRGDEQDLAREEKGHSWEFEDGKSIQWRPNGISLSIHREKHPVVLPTISGYFKPVRRVVVEGWTYFEVLLTPSQRVTASCDDLLKRLERDGRVRKKKLGHDVLVEVLNQMAPDSGAAYATYGIFARPTGELELCSRPVPIRDEQLSAHEEIEPGLQYPPTLADFQAYVELLDHFHPFEALPTMGLAAITPVAQTLRASDIFVGHVWNWSLAHGLGKSLICLAYSRNLWGRAPTSGSGINSEFRLSAHLDAAAVPQCVEEGESLNVYRLGPDIKTSAERPVVTRRGSTMLTMVPYSSRGILFVSGNRLAPKSGPALSRFLAPRFDSGKAAERRERKAQVDAIMIRLRPIGHALAEELVRLHPRLESLIMRIREVEQAIARTGAAQGDIRRAQLWAVDYVGLEVWEAAIAAAGGSWKAPPIDQFVAEVVIPVDTATYSGEETVVDAFRSWFESWRARNVRKVTNVSLHGNREEFRREEEVAGQGVLFEDGELIVGDRKILGTFIARPLIADYNKQAAPDLNIGSLGELAAAAADEGQIPHELVLDEKGTAKPVRFRSRTKIRAAFLPLEKEGE